MIHKTKPNRPIIQNPSNVPEWVRGSEPGQRICLQLVTTTATTIHNHILWPVAIVVVVVPYCSRRCVMHAGTHDHGIRHRWSGAAVSGGYWGWRWRLDQGTGSVCWGCGSGEIYWWGGVLMGSYFGGIRRDILIRVSVQSQLYLFTHQIDPHCSSPDGSAAVGDGCETMKMSWNRGLYSLHSSWRLSMAVHLAGMGFNNGMRKEKLA